MTSDESNVPAQPEIHRERNQPGVLCPRCDHLNYVGQEDCEDCGAPLFIECPHCGERTPRVFTRCPECRHRLRHRGSHRRKHGGKHRGAHSPSQRANRQLLWVLGVVFVLFGVAAVILLRFRV
jgi:hypothetical protein